jgi:selenide,water dikinase
LKREQAEEKDVKEVVEWMKRLNKTAGQLAVEFDLRGGTDVTGFGLLGHGLEMAESANIALEIEYNRIPFVSGARKYSEKGAFAGGLIDNQSYFGPRVHFDQSIDEPARMLLFDPQTSGGLLLGVPRERLSAFQARAEELGQPVWVIGEVRKGTGIHVK